ncbi:MAG TPA: GGDEF domain-containing protein [Candidatus Limnocylindrales bacterium]
MTPEALATLLAVAIVINLAIMAVLVVALVRRRGSAAVAPQPVSTAPSPAPSPDATAAETIEPMTAATLVTAGPDEDDVDATAEFDDEPLDDEGLLSILTDPLTGLDNRLAWDRAVRQENERKRRYGRPVSVVLAELYGLDALAERVGRDAADRLVPAIAEALRRYGRTTDRVARVGHARFHVLLPETDEVQAINYVERVRQACDLWLESGAVSLSLSMGWASPGPDDDIETAMIMAEDRLLAEHRRNARRAG